MEFSVPCECGAAVPVEAWSAGTTVNCTCGREVRVPSLHQLRARAGVPREEALPDQRIPKMIERGELPEDRCVQCGRTESPAVSLLAICEEDHSSSGSTNYLRIIIAAFLLFLGGRLLLRVFRSSLYGVEKEYGDWDGTGTAVLMPTGLCRGCRPMHGFNSIGFWVSAIAWLLLVGAGAVALVWSQWFVVACLGGASLLAFAVTAVIHRQRQQIWKELLRKTPIYAEVLTRFPGTKIREIRD